MVFPNLFDWVCVVIRLGVGLYSIGCAHRCSRRPVVVHSMTALSPPRSFTPARICGPQPGPGGRPGGGQAAPATTSTQSPGARGTTLRGPETDARPG